MSEANEVSKDLNVVDNDLKVEVKDDPSTEEVASHLEKAEENPMPSPAQEEAVIKKKYGGLLPRKTPLISKVTGIFHDHDRAFFDSADWALGKGSQKSKGPLEALRPKLQALAMKNDFCNSVLNGLSKAIEYQGTFQNLP
ncbi:methyltransferase-like protein 7A isoform X1 [Tanacetum coccineum]|uniref:Methyltransferase-like protein 7A isoform X1 n=1 Tax=Tanacetum coccineum TaxID=301880 RepID=A0ABQ5G7P7_9ASTR